MAKPIAGWLRHNRRILTIPFIIGAFLLARYESKFLWPSLALIALGESIRVWSAGYLYKDKILATGGPYRWIRNPLYAGSFLIALGFCVVAGSVWVWILAISYFLCCYLPVIRFEEAILSEKFANEYSMYSAKVPAIYPTFRAYVAASKQEFSWRQVIANKEYNAVLGILVAYLLLMLLRS